MVVDTSKEEMKRSKNVLKSWVSFAFGQSKTITFDPNGKGHCKSIQAVINSLNDSSAIPRNIFIKKGTYKEKIYVEKHNIVLEGEDRDKTIIIQEIAKDEWRCGHTDDSGAAASNLDGNDSTPKNLTVAIDYSFTDKESKTVYCASITMSHQKAITNNGREMTLRSICSTRVKAMNCSFRAYAGNTVSSWNAKDGMFYFNDCFMEGGVDFYCPGEYAWGDNSSFFANTGPAIIWHDGSGRDVQKTVSVNWKFDGYPRFNLGCHHKDAQFYLINCSFSKKMADKEIYLVTTANKILWGRRVYYFNCHRRPGGDYPWLKNDLQAAKSPPEATEINIDWLFKNDRHPEKNN